MINPKYPLINKKQAPEKSIPARKDKLRSIFPNRSIWFEEAPTECPDVCVCSGTGYVLAVTLDHPGYGYVAQTCDADPSLHEEENIQ